MNLILEWLRRRTPSNPPPQKIKKLSEEFFTCEIAENNWVYKELKMCIFFSVNIFFRYDFLHLAKETVKRRETETSNKSKQIG